VNICNREHMPEKSPSPGSHSALCGIIAVSSRSQRVFKMRQNAQILSEDSRNVYGQVPIFIERATECHVG
jgi:hypothetical protein